MAVSTALLFLTAALLLSPCHAFAEPKQSLYRLPSKTRLSMSSETAETASSVAIIGMGVLGTSLAKQLLETTDYNLMGITKSKSRHEDLLKEICTVSEYKERLQLMTFEEAMSANNNDQYPNVVFCAPPSGFEDYPQAIASAAKLHNKQGSFVFTSSGGVYPDVFDGEIVNEMTPLDESTPRKARGINAEKECLQNGGCVLRLAGLYTLERGAHNYWLERGDGVVKGRDDGIINLLHYDDAASACVAALRVGPEINSRKVFLISDGHSTTRKGICESALQSARYKGREMPKFEGAEDEKRGKIYDGSWSERTLNWKAMYISFDDFMKTMA